MLAIPQNAPVQLYLLLSLAADTYALMHSKHTFCSAGWPERLLTININTLTLMHLCTADNFLVA